MPQPIQPTQDDPFPVGNPTGPCVDPSGLRYDRADLDETVPVPAGVEVIPVGTRHRLTVPVKACCGTVLAGERCDCRTVRRQIRRAPVVVFRAYNLRALREAGITAVDLDRRAA
ncbi:hypothetical protein ACGFIG_09480 [Micromonospora sp. NPDC049048]|uniref:hypothetical protein n=1 Tax=Micromonospora sp. NPDC049048 TaxID=3364263 RepID=UPI0037189B67